MIVTSIRRALLGMVLAGSGLTVAHASGADFDFVSSAAVDAHRVAAASSVYTVSHFVIAGVVSSSSSSVLPNGTPLHGDCVIYSHGEADRNHLEGACLIKGQADASYLMRVSRNGQFGHGGSQGQMELQGVSGSFAQLRGSCVFNPVYQKDGGLYLTVLSHCHID